MGRKSVKDNKDIFQLSREKAELTREKAAEKIGFMSEDRIERIESGKSRVQADEVLAMADAYCDPTLCNRYCSKICPIGRKNVPEVELSDIRQITLEAVSALNSLESHKMRMIEIAADGKIDESETEDFENIKRLLTEISMSARKLKMWTESVRKEK